MSTVQRIEGMRAQVQAAAGLAELLAVAWEAFTLLRDTCQACEQQTDELFPAFAFAAAAAARGRLMLASAPSLDIGGGTEAMPGAAVKQDLDQVAAALGNLAWVLGDRLAQACVGAAGAGDQAACAQAADEAARAAGLLARDR